MSFDERVAMARRALRDEVGARPIPEVAVLVRSARRRRWAQNVAALALVLAIMVTAVVVAQSPDDRRVQATGSTEPVDQTPVATDGSIMLGPISSFAGEDPSFEQSVVRLEDWYRNALADAPAGRPVLYAERMICDLQATPGGHAETQYSFASYFPLSEPLTEARLAEGCLQTDWIRQANLSAELMAAGHVLCATHDLGDYEPRRSPLLRPVIVFGATTCQADGYEPAPSKLLNDWNTRRGIEIRMRAVPRDCPTPEDAVGWARKVAKEAVGTSFHIEVRAPDTTNPPAGVAAPPAGATWCYRDVRPNWDTGIVTISASGYVT